MMLTLNDEQDERVLLSDPERDRLRATEDGEASWRQWGPYLSARQWGTVREDYSADGDAWNYFTHDMAAYRTYRWGEDGLLGICDDTGSLCFGLALWNGEDPILKERPFGLSNPQGNHGEDLKDYYYFLDNTPTHSYMKALYKYPQRRFPYDDLVAANARRTREEPEYELLDTGVFAENRYFDVTVEYAKAAPDDMVIRISVANRGPETARLHLLPTLWFRNTWAWGRDHRRPRISAVSGGSSERAVRAVHHELGTYGLLCQGKPALLFTNNETNTERLYGEPNKSRYVKDGIHRAVVHRERHAVNSHRTGTKVAAQYVLDVLPGATETVLLRLSAQPITLDGAAEVVEQRRAEADQFYAPLLIGRSADEQRVVRQSLAGLLWSKQYYNYDVRTWLEGDPMYPAPPERKHGRNREWRTLVNDDVICMPDTWEYPWYAAWDLAFHCLPLALVDPECAKQQLSLLLRESYMKPDGQIPAYEWALSQVNPPVSAWAALKIYNIEKSQTGVEDRDFLERVFHKLLVNFAWWVNRKDPEGRNVFEAGFLGLDNIGVFNRDASLPTGGYMQQADASAWMGMFSLDMLAIALELAAERPAYEDIAYKFFEHFMHIAQALNAADDGGRGLWDEEDRFFYDCLRLPDGGVVPLRVRSLVGLLPLCAVLTIPPTKLGPLPNLRLRMERFLAKHPDLANLVVSRQVPGEGEYHLLSLAGADSIRAVLDRMLDPREFLGEYGIRSLSKYHQEHPYTFHVGHESYQVTYEPGVSSSPIFGGNSNWRGPVWFPTNYLLIDALRSLHGFYGDGFVVEHPTGSGRCSSLAEVARDLAGRLIDIYLPDRRQRYPAFGKESIQQDDPHWREHLLFFEYFHGDTGEGLGASHQTGWSALVANLMHEIADLPEKHTGELGEDAVNVWPCGSPPSEVEVAVA